jgi:hypothetical protein
VCLFTESLGTGKPALDHASPVCNAAYHCNRVLCKAVKHGLNVLLCMWNGTHCLHTLLR